MVAKSKISEKATTYVLKLIQKILLHVFATYSNNFFTSIILSQIFRCSLLCPPVSTSKQQSAIFKITDILFFTGGIASAANIK